METKVNIFENHYKSHHSSGFKLSNLTSFNDCWSAEINSYSLPNYTIVDNSDKERNQKVEYALEEVEKELKKVTKEISEACTEELRTHRVILEGKKLGLLQSKQILKELLG